MSDQMDESFCLNDSNDRTNCTFAPVLCECKEYGQVVPLLVIAVLGVSGNAVSFVVIRSSKKLMKSTTFFLLLILCLFDSAALILNSLECLFEKVDTPIWNKSVVACRGFAFWMDFSFNGSAWILAAISFERTVGMIYPIKVSQERSTNGSAKGYVIVAVIVVITTISNLPLIVIPDYADGNCTVAPTRLTKWLTVGLKAFFYGYCPIAVILVCNAITICKIAPWRCAQFPNSLLSAPSSSSSSSSAPSSSHPRHRLHHTRIVGALLTVTSAFTVLCLPWAILCTLHLIDLDYSCERTSDPLLQGAFLAADLLANLNHAVNFLLYAFASPQFRQQMSTMLRGRGESLASTTSTSARTRKSTRSSERKTVRQALQGLEARQGREVLRRKRRKEEGEKGEEKREEERKKEEEESRERKELVVEIEKFETSSVPPVEL